MYKYGGIYNDLDVIVVKEIVPELPEQFTATVMD